MNAYIVFECAPEDTTALKVLVSGLCAHSDGYAFHGVTVEAKDADPKALADLLDSVPWHSESDLIISLFLIDAASNIGCLEHTAREFSQAVAKKEIT